MEKAPVPVRANFALPVVYQHELGSIMRKAPDVCSQTVDEGFQLGYQLSAFVRPMIDLIDAYKQDGQKVWLLGRDMDGFAAYLNSAGITGWGWLRGYNRSVAMGLSSKRGALGSWLKSCGIKDYDAFLDTGWTGSLWARLFHCGHEGKQYVKDQPEAVMSMYIMSSSRCVELDGSPAQGCRPFVSPLDRRLDTPEAFKLLEKFEDSIKSDDFKFVPRTGEIVQEEEDIQCVALHHFWTNGFVSGMQKGVSDGHCLPSRNDSTWVDTDDVHGDTKLVNQSLDLYTKKLAADFSKQIW